RRQTSHSQATRGRRRAARGRRRRKAGRRPSYRGIGSWVVLSNVGIEAEMLSGLVDGNAFADLALDRLRAEVPMEPARNGRADKFAGVDSPFQKGDDARFGSNPQRHGKI